MAKLQCQRNESMHSQKMVLADWSNKQKNQSNQDTNNIQTHAICKHKNTKPKK